jgi:hypothetical protein
LAIRIASIATFILELIVGGGLRSYDRCMLMEQFSEVCREEIEKAGRALKVAYEMMRAADERALRTLFMFFQD